ncbi:MAG: glycosyltransferase family 2 protein [Prevotella sp.]|nr:glycosyltransferase family 2 protein [Prevotella sp.]
MRQLSILIPTYNDDCFLLAKKLSEQASKIEGLQWEIIVADDGSKAVSVVERNMRINQLKNSTYIIRKENTGRATIRNFLAKKANYPWLLFVDAGLHIPNRNFIGTYLANFGEDVICGGVIALQGHSENLRYKYEHEAMSRFSAKKRSRHPYHNFRTANFLIKRTAILAHPLRENIKSYGYEDVMFGKDLEQNHIPIKHIDNPIAYTQYEDNKKYLCKVEKSLHTLFAYRNELNGYSPILKYTKLLDKYRFRFFVRHFHHIFKQFEKNNLCGSHPSLTIFKLYKIGYYCCLQ